MSQGKGISDAVRESIRDWITPDVAEKIPSQRRRTTTTSYTSYETPRAGFVVSAVALPTAGSGTTTASRFPAAGWACGSTLTG